MMTLLDYMISLSIKTMNLLLLSSLALALVLGKIINDYHFLFYDINRDLVFEQIMK